MTCGEKLFYGETGMLPPAAASGARMIPRAVSIAYHSEKPLAFNIGGKSYDAITIGQNSDIDTVLVKTPYGNQAITVDSPVFGPFSGVVECTPIYSRLTTIPAGSYNPYFLNRYHANLELFLWESSPATFPRIRSPRQLSNATDGILDSIETLIMVAFPAYGRFNSKIWLESTTLATQVRLAALRVVATNDDFISVPIWPDPTNALVFHTIPTSSAVSVQLTEEYEFVQVSGKSDVSEAPLIINYLAKDA